LHDVIRKARSDICNLDTSQAFQPGAFSNGHKFQCTVFTFLLLFTTAQRTCYRILLLLLWFVIFFRRTSYLHECVYVPFLKFICHTWHENFWRWTWI